MMRRASGVLPVNFLNAAQGNTNTLNAVAQPGGGAVEPYYDTAGDHHHPGEA